MSHRFIPKFEKTRPEFNQEEFKKNLDGEQKTTLLQVNHALDELWQSIVGDKETDIGRNYKVIVTEKVKKHPDFNLIHLSRSAVAGELNIHLARLWEINYGHLSPQLIEYIKFNKLDLPNLSKEITEQIRGFGLQDLSNNPEENIFRISVWKENISWGKNTIEQILK